MKIIKNEEEYEAVLAEIEALIDGNPSAGTGEADRLEVLAVLARDYESHRFPLGDPDPVGAIRFRMEQQGLEPRDLVQYLGSRAKVSEVLAGKRNLTLTMIRALHKGLGIPAAALLGAGRESLLQEEAIAWERFPLREMAARGWIKATASDIRDRAEELVREFLAPLGPHSMTPALFRKTDHVRSARGLDVHALTAWTAHVLFRAKQLSLGTYQPGTITSEFMRDLVKLSVHSNGPCAAQSFLSEHGIALIVAPHLPRTQLDGAAMLSPEGNPVIGLTLRYDRVDNFWFTLLHEVVHVGQHLHRDLARFFDDLNSESGNDPLEAEADALAGEALIPTSAWKKSDARVFPVLETVVDLANELGIHPAIVAGRIQHEKRNYKLLHNLVGRGEVRACFPDVSWGDG
jgi:HTH-type transcriptional regulator/antitoxin HigA